jgi:glycosyltransferase involved in cell wall biosynthesis
MKRPRILHLVDDFSMEGVARHLVDLSRQLMGECQVTLATGPKFAREGLVRKAATAIGVPVKILPSYKSDGSQEGPANPSRELAEAVNTLKPTILHTHSVDALHLGQMIRKKCTVPHFAHTFHQSPGKSASDSRKSIRKALSGMTVTADSRILARKLAGEELISENLIQVITPVMASRRFLRQRPGGVLRERVGVAPGEPLIGMAGILTGDHDGLLFIKVFSTLAGSIPSARAVVVGDGPERAAMEALADQKGIGSKILFAGWHLDLPTHCGDLDLMIVTSRREGFSTAAMEAMVAGVPLVGTRASGVVDLVEDGVTGLLADPGDGAALAGASILLLRDANFRSKLGTAARERGQEFLKNCDAGAEYFKLYSSLMNTRNGARESVKAAP